MPSRMIQTCEYADDRPETNTEVRWQNLSLAVSWASIPRDPQKKREPVTAASAGILGKGRVNMRGETDRITPVSCFGSSSQQLHSQGLRQYSSLPYTQDRRHKKVNSGFIYSTTAEIFSSGL